MGGIGTEPHTEEGGGGGGVAEKASSTHLEELSCWVETGAVGVVGGGGAQNDLNSATIKDATRPCFSVSTHQIPGQNPATRQWLVVFIIHTQTNPTLRRPAVRTEKVDGGHQGPGRAKTE